MDLGGKYIPIFFILQFSAVFHFDHAGVLISELSVLANASAATSSWYC